jgi:hypothetical protein
VSVLQFGVRRPLIAWAFSQTEYILRHSKLFICEVKFILDYALEFLAEMSTERCQGHNVQRELIMH